MRRIGFTLDDFTRIQWAPSARQIWESRIQRINTVLRELEVTSVMQGFRRGALLSLTPDEIIKLSNRLAGTSTQMILLEKIGTANRYNNRNIPYVEGQPVGFRVAVAKGTDAMDWSFWPNISNENIGTMLGYPICCRQFFQRWWGTEGHIDLTWRQALGASGGGGLKTVDITPLPESNVILRWLGIRAVFHLPCTFRCKESAAIGRELLNWGRDLGFVDEMEWLEEMLNWPVSWSALHGIAEILTPVCRISTSTDATPIKYTVNVKGRIYPEGGARGIKFPYTEAKSKGHALVFRPEKTWKDNGFSSLEAMRKAHDPIISLAETAAKLIKGEGTVIDLGCGNGALLRRIEERVGLKPHGVDNNGLITNVYSAMRFRGMDLYDKRAFDQHYNLVLLSLPRLSERPPAEARELLERIRRNSDYVIFYNYSDTPWTTVKLGSLIAAHKNEICEAELVQVWPR
jgi:hypothetical protein